MREIRLVHDKPEQNARFLQNAVDPHIGETSKSTYRLTSSADSFTWTSTLTEDMMQFLRFLKNNRKSLVVRLHGFSQDDENMIRWFQQACQWDLIVGLVSNNLESQALFICHAISNQNASVSMFLKIHLYPADFDFVDTHISLAQALQRSNCLNRLEMQVLKVGLQEAAENMTRTLSRGVGSNRSIRNLILSGWGDSAWNHFFADLADRDVCFDQLILENAGFATLRDEGNSREWCRTLNRAKHVGFLACKNSVATSHCLYHLDSAELIHLQLTNAGWTSRQMDELLVQLSQSCPNLSTLDVYRNCMDDLTFPRFSALMSTNAASRSTSSHRRPLGSLTGFLLDANPILSDEKLKRVKLGPSLYSLFQEIPSLLTILDTEAQRRTKRKDRVSLDKIIRCVRGLAIDLPRLGIQLPSGAWPLLLSTANRTLQEEPSLQAQAIYDFLVNASAVLTNQAAADPINAAITTNKSAGKEPVWVAFQKLLSWR
ncbi:MAG: hypothetical protein SGBAC_008689 [Bacillariaceae sp.]